jgi:holin-like protein
MRYLRQFVMILFVTCIGELLNYALPLSIPASIYGLVLMLVLLMTHVVKLENVDTVADILIEIMPVMFIPAGVGLIRSWDVLRPVLVPVLVITVAVTFIVMIVTGKVSDALLKGSESETIIEIHGEEEDDLEGRNLR